MNSHTFLSTRGRAPAASFADVLLAGLAPDGGLYLPQAWPQFSEADLAAFAGISYPEAAYRVLSRFTGPSFSETELREAIAREAGDDFQKLFGEAFNDAYEAQIDAMHRARDEMAAAAVGQKKKDPT